MSKEKSIAIPCTLYWCHIREPNEKGKYPTGKYEVVAGNLSAAAISAIQNLGLSKYLKNKGDEQGTFVKLRSKIQPALRDKDKNVLEPDFLIGNGSKAVVVMNAYEAGDYGLAAGLKKIQLLELVEYTSNEDDLDNVVGEEE